jgi:hypothetical protein
VLDVLDEAAARVVDGLGALGPRRWLERVTAARGR